MPSILDAAGPGVAVGDAMLDLAALDKARFGNDGVLRPAFRRPGRLPPAGHRVAGAASR